jgi:hypothetical protein
MNLRYPANGDEPLDVDIADDNELTELDVVVDRRGDADDVEVATLKPMVVRAVGDPGPAVSTLPFDHNQYISGT